jgi:hypothetical protein
MVEVRIYSVANKLDKITDALASMVQYTLQREVFRTNEWDVGTVKLSNRPIKEDGIGKEIRLIVVPSIFDELSDYTIQMLQQVLTKQSCESSYIVLFGPDDLNRHTQKQLEASFPLHQSQFIFLPTFRRMEGKYEEYIKEKINPTIAYNIHYNLSKEKKNCHSSDEKKGVQEE